MYQLVQTLNYYALSRSALHVLSAAHHDINLALALGENQLHIIWTGRSDKSGQLLQENLSFLADYCDAEYTPFVLVCAGQRLSFSVRWTPQVHTLGRQGTNVFVRISGPPESSFILRWRSIEGTLLQEDRAFCDGEYAELVFTPQQAETIRTCREVTVQYVLEDGSTITASRYLAYQSSREMPISPDWLAIGLGISDASLLDALND